TRCDPVRIGPAPGRRLDARQADPTGRGPRPVPERSEDRVLLSVPKAGHRRLLGGQNAGVEHAQRGWQLHLAAGGSYGAPIYASIDEDPSYDQYKSKVAPYLKGWEAVLGHQRSASTRTPKPSNGRCRTGSAPTSGSTTGVRTGGSPTRPHICTRSRSTRARAGALGWTSTAT